MLKAVIHSLMLGLDFRLETIAGEVFGGAVVRSLAMLSVFGTSEFQAFVNPPKHRILCIIRYRHVGRFPQRPLYPLAPRPFPAVAIARVIGLRRPYMARCCRCCHGIGSEGLESLSSVLLARQRQNEVRFTTTSALIEY